MAEVNFRVVHVTHSNGTISVHTPVGSSLRWSYKATDVGDISYDLALSDQELDFAGPDSFAPYATDWRLGMNSGTAWQTISSGIHTGAGLKPRSGVVNVQGKDWSHWLEQPVWFDFYDFDFDDLVSGTPAHKKLKQAFNKGYNKQLADTRGYVETIAARAWIGPKGATQKTVIQDLIDTTKQSGGPNIPNIQPVFSGSGWQEILTYEIMIQDQTNVLEHIKTLAALSDPYGFDFYMDWDKKMYFFGPRKTLAKSPNPTWILTAANVVANTVPDFDWVNNGMLGTYNIGLGQGNPAIWKLKFDPETIALYRKWLKFGQVGDIYVNTFPEGIASATQGLQFGYPHKDLRLTAIPTRLHPSNPGGGFLNHIGDVVLFKWEVPPYHTIDAYFWINEQSFHTDPAGNWLVDLGLQQIYA